MSDDTTLSFTPAEPLPEAEGIYDSLPEDIVKSVLERSGFQDSQAVEPSEVAPSEEEAEETPPVEADDEGIVAAPPSAPGGPLFSEDTPNPDVITLPDGRQFPLALVAEWADRPEAPILQQPVATPSTPLPISSPPSNTPLQLPQITEEDLEMAGPVGRALLMVASRQAAELAYVRDQVSAAQQAVAANTRRESAEIANSAASNFQSQYNLPVELMEKVKNSAEVSDINRYLERDPDPYKAVDYALTRAYWNLPEARQYEFERQTAGRQEAQSRKRKLAGISGSGGSGPRGTPAPDESPEGLRAAAVELARAAMYGDEQ